MISKDESRVVCSMPIHTETVLLEGSLSADFSLTETGGDGIPPSIESVRRVDDRTVSLSLSEPIQPGSWLELAHVSSGTSVSLGYLPGDVNGDGTVSPSQDLLALIDCINIAGRCNEWQYDIDRSGHSALPTDRSRLLALMRGARGARAWAAVRFPQDVLAALRESSATKRGTGHDRSRGTAEVHIRLDVTDLGPTASGSVSDFDSAEFTPMLGVPVSPNDQLLVHLWARNNTASEILLRGV